MKTTNMRFEYSSRGFFWYMSRLLGPLRPRVMKNVLFKSTVTVLRFAPKPPECDLWARFTPGDFFIKNFIFLEKSYKDSKKAEIFTVGYLKIIYNFVP